MPYIMNCLPSQVSVQAFGKWFTLKPNEIKMFHQEELARFIGQAKGDEGLVEVEDRIMEMDPSDVERQAYLEQKRREGIQKRINRLEWQKNNLLGSLKLDLEIKGIKADPLVLASKGDVAAIKELRVLTEGEVGREESNAEILRKELGLDGNTDSTNTGAANSRRSDSAQPAESGKQPILRR